MLHANKQLASINADECVRFVNAWRNDRIAFARAAKDTSWVGNYAAACEYLKLTTWRYAEFGVPDSHRSRMTGALKNYVQDRVLKFHGVCQEFFQQCGKNSGLIQVQVAAAMGLSQTIRPDETPCEDHRSDARGASRPR